MKKKKKVITTMIIIGLLLCGVGIAKHIAYEKAGEYMMGQMLENQLVTMIKDELGIDVGESGRELTETEVTILNGILGLEGSLVEEEVGDDVETADAGGYGKENTISTVQSVEEKMEEHKKPTQKSSHKEFPKTTDNLKKIVEEKVQQVAKSVPAKDKKAMTNLIMTNLTMTDIQYLVGLVLDGISSEDLSIAKEIALKNFDNQELVQVRTYYYQYKHLMP